MPDKNICRCLVVYFDIFGFSPMIENVEAQEHLSESLLHIWDWIHDLSQKRNMLPYLFSDGGYLLYPISDNPSNLLNQAIQDVSLLQNKYLDMRFVLRGALSVGKVTYSSRLLLGQPVVNAYRYESQFCPGPFLIFPLKEIDELVSQGFLIRDVQITFLPVKGNAGIMQCHIIFPPDKAAYIQYIAEQAAFYTTNGPFEYGKLWFDTLTFLTSNFQDFKNWSIHQ